METPLVSSCREKWVRRPQAEFYHVRWLGKPWRILGVKEAGRDRKCKGLVVRRAGEEASGRGSQAPVRAAQGWGPWEGRPILVTLAVLTIPGS